jgi:N-acetylmuramoyl-L-alanine amidase
MPRRQGTPPEDAASQPGRASWRVPRIDEGPSRQPRGQREPAGDARVRGARQKQKATRPKNVPTMPARRRDTQVRSPALTLAGAVLIGLLALMAFAGGRFFERVTPSSPTPEVPAVFLVPTSPPTLVVEPTRPAFETPIPLPASFPRAPVVCLDPGHGGPDRGFIRYGADGTVQLEEEPLVLAQALALRSRLEHRSFQVVMTRETNAAVNASGKDVNGDGRTAAHDPPGSDHNKTIDELQARIDICNAAGADLLVSLHLNGYSTGRPRGYETWFTRERPFGDRNATIATLVYAHLKEQLGAIGYVLPVEEERGVLPDTTADVQREEPVFQHFIMTGPAVPGVVSPSMMPGVIGEALFLSNDQDAALLATAAGQEAIVTAYELAIVEYFELYPPAIASVTPTPE